MAYLEGCGRMPQELVDLVNSRITIDQVSYYWSTDDYQCPYACKCQGKTAEVVVDAHNTKNKLTYPCFYMARGLPKCEICRFG